MSNARNDAGAIDLSAAQAFCDALAGSDSPLTFQTFAEREGATARAMVKHGELRTHAEALQRANDSGAGVFVTVNATDGRGRKGTNITGVRAVFADFDGAPLPDAFPLRPHALIESSRARWHAYWFCSIPLDHFKAVQHSIAQTFNSDPAVCDLPRVMRLPGFIHQKAEPFQTRIEALETFPAYRDREILDAFPAIAQTSEKGPCRIPEGKRNSELMRLANYYHRMGWHHEQIRGKLLTDNATRCQLPLDPAEVESIAKRASEQPRKAKQLRPLAYMDTPAYIALSYTAKVLLNEAERLAQLQGNGNIALTASLLEPRGIPARTIRRAVRELIESGLLVRTRDAVYGQLGREKVCALYLCPHLPISANLAAIAPH